MKKIILFLCATMLFANFPGGITAVELGVMNQEPTVYFENHRVWVKKNKNGSYTAFVGVGLNAKGKNSLSITIQETNTTLAFNIGKKSYPVQKIYMDSNKYVELSKSDLERVLKEKEQMKQALMTYSDIKAPLRLDSPLKGRISSAFGLERYFNDQPRSPHGGIDIAAPTGTKIKAAQSGKVLLAGDFFYCGKFVLLDHGKGFMTLYCHLNKIYAKKGSFIKKGEHIAEVGSTGRATGPHLHFSAILNGSFIDPSLLFSSKHNQTKATQAPQGQKAR